MKKMIFGALMLTMSLSACSISGLGPDFDASDAYVAQVLDAGNQPPSPAECDKMRAMAADSAQLALMRETDRAFIAEKLPLCPGTLRR